MLCNKLKKISKTALSLTLAILIACPFVGFDLTFANAESVGSSSVNLTGLKVIEMYSKVQAGTKKIVSDYIKGPRELDDYNKLGTYKKAGVPHTVSELRLKDSAALKDYPKAGSKFEALSMAISKQVYNGLKNSQAVFFTGAESDTAVGVAGGVRRAYPEAKIGLVYLNADCGSEVSTIMAGGEAKDNLWNRAGDGKSPFNALLIGDGREMDAEDSAVLAQIKTSADRCVSVDTDGFKNKEKWELEVKVLADSVDVIYLHVDASILHQAYVPHMEAGAGEGPTIWTMLDNLEAVMDTGKVAAVNMSSMYSEASDTGLTANGFTVPEFPTETATERVNRFAMPSILSGVRMVSTALKNWEKMPDVPKAVAKVPSQKTAKANFDGIKVVEILTRNKIGGVLVGRRAAAPMATDGKYTYEQRGEVIEENDQIYPSLIGYPRELDDWTLAGIYNQAGVSYETAQVLMGDEDANKKYPEYTRYEALCREISNEVYGGVAEDKAVVVVGSGCMPVPAVAGGLRRAYGDDAKLGVIYIDAHGDINTADSTYSGGIGGMDLSPTMGIDPHPTIQHWWEVCSDKGEPIDELLHACGRNLDSGVDDYDPASPYEFGEMLNLKKATSKDKYILSVDDFNDKATFDAALADFSKKVDAVYLHIDMDALDGVFLPNGGTPEGYHFRPSLIGPSVWTVVDRIQKVMETGKVSVVNLASTYGDPAYDPERLLRQGFVYPDIEDEIEGSEEARNRANTTAILSGMRVLNSMVANWESCPKADYGEVKSLAAKFKPSGSKYLKLNCTKLASGKTKITVSDKTKKKLKQFEDMGYTLHAKFYRAAGKSTNKYQYRFQKDVTAKNFKYIPSKGTYGKKYHYKAVISVMDGDTEVAVVTTRSSGATWKKR